MSFPHAVPTTIGDATDQRRFPLLALALMACTGFVVIMTETLPAGLLPQISSGLAVSEGAAGQLVGAYAIGSVLAAIPAIALTRGAPRKPLLLAGLLGFLVVNLATAFAPSLAVALLARLVAGGFAGLLWGMLAGYARRIVAPELSGRALAIAMTGTPLALAAGTPLGSWLGTSVGWRWSFAAMSAVTMVVLLLALRFVPAAPGQRAETRTPMPGVLRTVGVGAILAVVFTWMLAHNLLYTYIAPYLREAGVALRPDAALFAFGIAALVGIWITGTLADRMLRRLALTSIAFFVLAASVLALMSSSIVVALVAIGLWGVAFGGAATQLQTAIGEAAGENADIANAFLTTSFNLAIFGGAALGALLVNGTGPQALPVAMGVLALVALVLVALSRRAAFPIGR